MQLRILWLLCLIFEMEHTQIRLEGAQCENKPYRNPTLVGGCRTLRCYEYKYAEGTRQNDPVTSG